MSSVAKRATFVFAAAFALLAAGLAWWSISNSGGFGAHADLSKLWSWSLFSTNATIADADGRSIRLAHEPFAMLRNLTLAAAAALACAAYVSRDPGPAAGLGMRRTRECLDDELSAILFLVQAYAEKNRTYSAALARGHEHLAEALNPEQMR